MRRPWVQMRCVNRCALPDSSVARLPYIPFEVSVEPRPWNQRTVRKANVFTRRALCFKQKGSSSARKHQFSPRFPTRNIDPRWKSIIAAHAGPTAAYAFRD
ncbi:hypothetical protein L596_003999 [Steinernema carpocapsae]|uniref:Uncharacterized protein n=1 Tax=Steinernema carpocapsae TaxID=34508 RepID=A0A4U8UVE9_STECR|nr:hypothetical protein L596_003999 [Steinernema carpocapsae]